MCTCAIYPWLSDLWVWIVLCTCIHKSQTPNKLLPQLQIRAVMKNVFCQWNLEIGHTTCISVCFKAFCMVMESICMIYILPYLRDPDCALQIENLVNITSYHISILCALILYNENEWRASLWNPGCNSHTCALILCVPQKCEDSKHTVNFTIIML